MTAMESTGSYWKPLYNILEASGLETMVVNARYMKAVPGRKTDVRDAEWIADLLQHGLLQPSYIPDKAQRELRELVGYRKSLVRDRTAELNRLQKMLEGANIKLSGTVADINGKSAGKRRCGKTRKGNAFLRSTLVVCAHSAVKNKNSFFYAQFQRISARRGNKRAYVAVAHSMLVAIYHVLKDGVVFKDLGAGYYNQFNRERKTNSYLKKLKALGWEEPVAMEG